MKRSYHDSSSILPVARPMGTGSLPDPHLSRQQHTAQALSSSTSAEQNRRSERLSVVVAVVENRAREVCLSTYSVEAGSQVNAEIFQDSQSYAETLAHLVSLSPTEILLHDGSRGRVLSLKIIEAFLSTGHQLASGHQTRALFVNRQYFDQDRGAEMLKRVSWSAIDSTMMASYTFLAASYCLLKYVENVSGRNFTPQSLKISLQMGNKTRMMIEQRLLLS